AAAQLHGCDRVEVDEDHADLAAVAGVDRARSVDQRDAAAGRQPGPRMDEGGVTQRQRDGDTGGHHGALPRRQREVGGGHEIGTGVAGVGVRRDRQVGVEPLDQHLHHVRQSNCVGYTERLGPPWWWWPLLLGGAAALATEVYGGWGLAT